MLSVLFKKTGILEKLYKSFFETTTDLKQNRTAERKQFYSKKSCVFWCFKVNFFFWALFLSSRNTNFVEGVVNKGPRRSMVFALGGLTRNGVLTREQENKRTREQENKRTREQENKRTREAVVLRSERALVVKAQNTTIISLSKKKGSTFGRSKKSWCLRKKKKTLCSNKRS